MSIYHNIEAIKRKALHYAKGNNCNYNVILMNPDESGKFHISNGSTYEFVTDSYFEKERPNVILLHRTDDLIKGYPQVIACDDTCQLYVKDESTAFLINVNPISKPKSGEEHWPIDGIDKIEGSANVTKFVMGLLFPEKDPSTLEWLDEEPGEYLDNSDAEKFKILIDCIEKIIAKHGENYDRQKDYDRVFNTSQNEK